MIYEKKITISHSTGRKERVIRVAAKQVKKFAAEKENQTRRKQNVPVEV